MKTKKKKDTAPIVTRIGETLVTDTGIFQLRELATSKPIEEFTKLVSAAGDVGLLGAQKRLMAIIAGDPTPEYYQQITVSIPKNGISTGKSLSMIKTIGFAGQTTHSEMERAEAVRALALLNRLLDGNSKEEARQKLLASLRALWMRLQLLPHEPAALAGKKMPGSAAAARAKRKTNPEALKKPEEILTFYRDFIRKNPGMKVKVRCKKVAKQLKEKWANEPLKKEWRVSARTIARYLPKSK